MSISYGCGEANVVKHRSRILFRRYFENTGSVACCYSGTQHFSTTKDFAPLPPSQLLHRRRWSMCQRIAEMPPPLMTDRIAARQIPTLLARAHEVIE